MTEGRRLTLLKYNSSEKRKVVQARYVAKNREVCIARSIASQKKKREYYTAKSIAWAKANPEKVKATKKRFYEANRETEIAIRIQWNNDHPKERKLIAKRFRENNPGKCAAWTRLHKARRKKATKLSAADQLEIEGFYQFCKIFRGFQVDHIIPLKGKLVSGLHVPSNLQILTASENAKKRNHWNGDNENGSF